MTDRHVFVDDGNCLVEMEYTDYGPFLHVKVDKWTRSVYEKLLVEAEKIYNLMRYVGEPRIFGLLPKENEEFASMFGWELGPQVEGKTLVVKEIQDGR